MLRIMVPREIELWGAGREGYRRERGVFRSGWRRLGVVL